MDNPPLRYLVNCALVIGCELDEVIEDEWRGSYPRYSADPAGPPPRTDA